MRQPTKAKRIAVATGPLVQWSGGECPVAPDTLVRCYFRGRGPYSGPAIYPSIPPRLHPGIWRHAPYLGRPDPQYDIVAYEPIEFVTVTQNG